LRRHRIALGILGLVAIVAVIGIGAITWLATTDLRPLIERTVSTALDRRLTIAGLRIRWRNPLAIELDDVRLANASWGSVPEMVHIARISAEIDLLPLLGGVLRYRQLTLVGARIVLERDAKGTGNWHFAAAKSPLPGGLAIVPKDRTQFPTLIDFKVSDGQVTYRTSSGSVLKIDFRHLAIGSASDDQPATIVADGGYDDTPVRLTADTQSFTVLRNGSVPFGTTFTLSTPSATADFKGTMTDPLDFDGVVGQLDIKAQKLGELLTIFDADTPAAFPLLLAGALRRTDDHWQLQDAKGKLATSAFGGTLALEEGGRGQADNASIALDFARLDLDPLLAGGSASHAATLGDPRDFSLRLEAKRATNIDAQVTAKEATFGAMRVADIAVHGRLAAAQAAISQLSFALGGGKVSASGSAHMVREGSHVVAHAALLGADMGQVARLIGAGTEQLAGSVAAHATLEMTGETLQEALKASRGHAVVAMTEGRVARALLEKASTDLRALFREGEGSAELTCVLGIVDFTNGIGAIAPLRLRTPETSLIAGGTVDLIRDRLDVTLKAEAGSTSLYALRIPLRVSGDFAALSVRPALGAEPPSLDVSATNDAVRALPAELQQLAERNSCLH
jgi:AsmA family protein